MRGKVARSLTLNSKDREAALKANAILTTGYRLSQQVTSNMLVAIGASTGGPEAVLRLLRLLPANMPGIVIVQHMPPVFTKMYAERLDQALPYEVCEATDGVAIRPGTVHIAPGDRHLAVKRRGDVFHTVVQGEQKVGGHCPAVDVLFSSVAEAAGPRAAGIILTGMGADGAQGLLKMRARGAITLGQDEKSCVVYGMPRKAFELGAVQTQAALTDLPQILLAMLVKQGRVLALETNN